MTRKPNVECKICGEKVYRRPSVIQSSKAVYCSRACYGFSNRKVSNCPSCNKEILAGQNKTHCSRACANKMRAGIKYTGTQPNSKVKDIRALKKRIEKRDGNSCKTCGVSEWMGSPLIFDLDHIDGDNKNNSLDNLRLLCPNCHRQTDTWGAKNINRTG